MNPIIPPSNLTVEQVEAVEDLAEMLEAAFTAGMREAARVCQDNGADWAYDLIVDAMQAREV